MPGNKKPKKAHVSFAEKMRRQQIQKNNATPLTSAQTLDVMLACHNSLEHIEKGTGDEMDVNNLAVASNICMVLAENGIGWEHMVAIKDAQLHILGLVRNLRQKKSLVLTGPGIQSVRHLMEIHDAQLSGEQTNLLDFKRAMRIIFERMKAGNYHVPEGKPATPSTAQLEEKP